MTPAVRTALSDFFPNGLIGRPLKTIQKQRAKIVPERSIPDGPTTAAVKDFCPPRAGA
jgi:hypothetical protein